MNMKNVPADIRADTLALQLSVLLNSNQNGRSRKKKGGGGQ